MLLLLSVKSNSALLSSFIAWITDSFQSKIISRLGAYFYFVAGHEQIESSRSILTVISLRISRLAPSFFRKCPR